MKNKFQFFTMFVLILALVLSGCAKTETPAAEVKPTEASVANPTEASVANPTELDIAVVHEMTVEEHWSKALMQQIEEIKKESPHGLTINVDYTENVNVSDAELVFREYAETGKYEIIWAHSGYSDQVKKVYKDYPEILWILAGPGNEGIGENVYWVYVHMHESGYILGTMAGMLTETDVLSSVAAFPFPDPADVLNGFIDGAKSVNPDSKVIITYIDSWYDPPTAKEAGQAQVAAGSDIIFVEREGPFELCEEKGMYCFGHYLDYYETYPDSFVTGTVLIWTPLVKYAIDVWWDHVVNGVPYAGQIDEPYWLSMAEGGGDVYPLRKWEETLPKDVVDKFNATRDAILKGELVVPLNEEPPQVD
jgi:basic membrane lipoprotein Med (substrate-binding protein (PBP1-ABC) superfamily)